MVSYEKTVIIMSFGGTQAPHIIKHSIKHLTDGKALCIPTKKGPINLPIRNEHVYLGVKTGYGHYERSTLLYRIQQAWQSFHRLHRVLISRALALPVRTRFQLWDACIHSVLFYGLSAITLDLRSAHAIRTQVTKELTNTISNSMKKQKLPDPVEQLLTATTKRLQSAQQYLSRLQPAITLLRWSQLLGQDLKHLVMPNPNTSLTAVTLIPRQPITCPICGITYSSLHAMRTHVGKSHPEASKAKLSKAMLANLVVQMSTWHIHATANLNAGTVASNSLRGEHLWGTFINRPAPCSSAAMQRPISRYQLLLKGCSHRQANRLHCQKRAWPHIMPPSLRYPCNSSRQFRNSQN